MLNIPLLIYSCAFVILTNIYTIFSDRFGNYTNNVSSTLWNWSSADVSLRNSIFDLVEDFDSKVDLLLYFVAIQQNINLFQKTVFHKKSLKMIISAFTIENLGKFTFWTKITGFWDSNCKERRLWKFWS